MALLSAGMLRLGRGGIGYRQVYHVPIGPKERSSMRPGRRASREGVEIEVAFTTANPPRLVARSKERLV